MSSGLGPRQMMWEFTPPHGIAFQQWQTSFRILFKEDRLEEMLAWFRLQVQLCEEAAEKGLFYNAQPPAPAHQPRKNRDRERPPSIHGTRRREPRRGDDDAADPESPPPPKRAAAAARNAGGNVKAEDGPMPSMSPAMAKPIAGKNTGSAAVARGTAQPTAQPTSDLEIENAALRKKLAELQGAATPEVEEHDEHFEHAPDTQPHVADAGTMPPPAVVAEEPEPDLSGPKVHRHRWTAGRYVIDTENTCVKCGTPCSGTEELCPVA